MHKIRKICIIKLIIITATIVKSDAEAQFKKGQK